MGWANSSLRLPEELPILDTKGRGVVCEAPLDDALHPSDRLPLSPGRRDSASSGAPEAPPAAAGIAAASGRNGRGE